MHTVRVAGLHLPPFALDVPAILTTPEGRHLFLTKWVPMAHAKDMLTVHLEGRMVTGALPAPTHLVCEDGRVIQILAGRVHFPPVEDDTGTWVMLHVDGILEVPLAWLQPQDTGEEPPVEAMATPAVLREQEVPPPKDIDITSHETPPGFREFLQADGTKYYQAIEEPQA